MEKTDSEVEELVVQILRENDRKLTTQEVEERVSGQGKKCPDSAVRFLSKLRYKGKIKGKLSKEHRGWIWWLE
jgi:repressor of nif and glnA expression